MNLHEIYEMLVRRGMPEHQEIRYDGYTGDGDVPSWGDGSVWGFYDGDEPLMACSEQQARDLITMHALRWVKTLPAMRVVCQRWQAGWNIFVALDDDYWDGHKPRPDSDKFTGDTILAGILDAGTIKVKFLSEVPRAICIATLTAIRARKA